MTEIRMPRYWLAESHKVPSSFAESPLVRAHQCMSGKKLRCMYDMRSFVLQRKRGMHVMMAASRRVQGEA